MIVRTDQTVAVRALKNAAPYIRMYKGKVFVIKAGGAIFEDVESTRELIEQVAILHQVGIKVVLVHGGGPQLTELSNALGVSTRMVQGRRITDEKSIDVTTMVLNGLINTRILAICRDLDVDAVGISGVDAGLIKAHKRPPVRIEGNGPEPVDFGFVGDIDSVDADVLRKQLDNGLMPVVSPLSADANGVLLNINADTVAAASARRSAPEADPGGRAGNSRAPRGFEFSHFLPISGSEASGGGVWPTACREAAAIEAAIRGGVRACTSFRTTHRTACWPGVHQRGAGTLIVADINASVPPSSRAEGGELTRTWDKGSHSIDACWNSRPVRTMHSTTVWSSTTCVPRSRTQRCCTSASCLPRRISSSFATR
jgi:acetylglutamate kinase